MTTIDFDVLGVRRCSIMNDTSLELNRFLRKLGDNGPNEVNLLPSQCQELALMISSELDYLRPLIIGGYTKEQLGPGTMSYIKYEINSEIVLMDPRLPVNNKFIRLEGLHKLLCQWATSGETVSVKYIF